MIVKVKAFANLREVFGGEASVRLKEGAVLKDLLSPVYLPPKALEAIIDESGNIKPSILILKNGRNIRFLRGLLTRLEDGNKVSIFPPVCGG
ncbi:MoaD family protein [Candidatus Atribacteria bacterium MT.SAG.1]|jgi:molybdopterin synthase sulfur carrier subunit|nr:MAG: MoaD family protein [Candidatus Atribacteria bacterium]TFB08594.1 MoaD family protein [Candidatus Atribacteria bacterium MT.SAG.1]